MKKDIILPKVDRVDVVVILEDELTNAYNVYLWNHGEDIIEGVIITSAGFGEDPLTGGKILTATLRHSLEVLLPNEVAKIEVIMPEVFGLYNEYWLSFWVNDVLYDKQYLFPPESIIPSNFKLINQFGKKGVLAQ
jgi:hypothetical protein